MSYVLLEASLAPLPSSPLLSLIHNVTEPCCLSICSVLLAASDADRRRYISKVSDFGLSRVLQNNKNAIKTQTFGTVTHVPPELLSKGTLTIKADVYAIGVLMWEIFTAEKVFKQLSDSEVILAVVTKKARPVFPSDVPSRFKFLAGVSCLEGSFVLCL